VGLGVEEVLSVLLTRRCGGRVKRKKKQAKRGEEEAKAVEKKSEAKDSVSE